MGYGDAYYKRKEDTYDYDPNVDYMKKMQEAAASGDYEQAAKYEQQRNEKIKGEGLSQYEQTNQYSRYLPKTTGQKMDEVMDQILNREDFSFDLNGDALYNQYKDLYRENAQLSMEDALAKASTLTGGYGNSYAQTIAQQAYQQEMDKLKTFGLELEEKRRSEYDAETDDLYRKYSLLAQQDDLEYGREQDAYNRELYEQEKADAEKQTEQDKAYELTMTMLQNGMMPSDAVLQASGLSAEDAQKIYDYSKLDVTGSSGGGSYSGGGGSGSSTEKLKSMTKSDMEELRDLYNEGSKKNDLTAFYNQKSLLSALGYDVSDFDSWAGQEYDGYTADEPSVTYSKYGVEDIYDVMRKLGTMSKKDAEDLMNDIQYDFSEEQWAMIEPILISRGIGL